MNTAETGVVLPLALAALGGGAGSAARFLIDRWVTARWRRDFPLGIFLVNLSGSFLLGLVVGSVLSTTWAALLGTGVLGGYTTFSTASVDAVRLARSGRGGVALGYAVGTGCATIGAAMLGMWCGDRLSGV